MTDSVPPVEVSRLLLLLLVAVGAVVSIVAEGRISNFAGGFAVGAGAVFVVSWLKRSRSEPGAGGSSEPGEAP